VLMIPINGRDHMREARGIVGNTGSPGHFTTLVRASETPVTVALP